MKRKIFVFQFTFLYILLLNPIYSVNKYYVNDATHTGDVWCTTGGTVGGTGTNALPYLTLSAAIAVATTGDTIFVDVGNYTDQNLTTKNSGVVIFGVYGKSIFTNGGADSWFINITKNNTVIENLTLSGYNAYDNSVGSGQVLSVLSGVTGVQVLNVTIKNTSVTSPVYGYPIEVASAAVANFSGGGSNCNTYAGGGGIHVNSTATVTINFYLFYGNNNSIQNGAALWIDGGDVSIKNSLFKMNLSDADTYGAAIYMSSGIANVYDCSIDSNKTWLSADAPGGSIFITGGTFKITRSIIKYHMQTGGSTSEGAGIAVTGGTVTIDSTKFSNNSGKATYGTDVYNKGGTVLARNCSFASTAGQIGSNVANSFSITTCGNPSVATGTIKKLDTNTPTYTANPTVPGTSGSCATQIIVLPIELLQFEAACINNQASLIWQTAAEINNHLFTIEKSFDGVQFNSIGKVNGSGNSSHLINYSFTDKALNTENAYYRLSQEDFNGRISRSNIIYVEHFCSTSLAPQITVYPNPSLSGVHMDFKLYAASEVFFEIKNELGQVIKQVPVQSYQGGFQTTYLDINDLLSGVYFIETTINNQAYTHKLIKL